MSERVAWDGETEKIFYQVLEPIPDMIRGIAETRVAKKAESLARKNNRQVITRQDMIEAFFAETPGGFIPPMKQRMEELGIDYAQYGF